MFAIRSRIRVRRGDVGQDRAGSGPHVSGDRVLGDQRLHHAENGLVQRRVDDLPGAGVGTRVEGHQCADAREDGGECVADRDACSCRRPVGFADDAAETAHRLADRAVPRPVGVRSGLAVARHPHDDQPRVQRHEVTRSEAPPLERPGSEVLDEDVGIGDEPANDLLTLGLTKVERDRALASGHDRPPQRGAAGLLAAPLPHRVALTRRFDLDHVGTEVREELAAEWPREQLTHLDDPQIVQWPAHRITGRAAWWPRTRPPLGSSRRSRIVGSDGRRRSSAGRPPRRARSNCAGRSAGVASARRCRTPWP